MTAKLHNLFWSDTAYTPGWVNNLITSGNKTALIAVIKSRINYYIGNEKNKFTRVDLANEFGWHSGSNSFENVLSQSDVISIYQDAIAKAAGGSIQVGLNTYAALQYSGDNTKYLAQINAFKAANAVQYAGMQDYIDGTYGSTGLSTAQTMLMNLQSAHIPLEETEFGLQSSVPTSQAATILDNTMRLMMGSSNVLGMIDWYPLTESGAFAPNSYLFSGSSLTAAGSAQVALLKTWLTLALI